MSESFGCSGDPLEVEFPFCVVKSFPQTNEHVIAWSKAKVDNLLRSKPEKFNQFWMDYGNSLDDVAEGNDSATIWKLRILSGLILPSSATTRENQLKGPNPVLSVLRFRSIFQAFFYKCLGFPPNSSFPSEINT